MDTTSKLALAGALLLSLAGCASIDSSDYRQTILVRTNPPGAQIFDKSGAKLGVSPAYVRVRRQRHPTIQVSAEGDQKTTVDLVTHYRWADSFALNLVIVYAPVGWLVDWMTGTAWNIDDPPELNISGISSRPKSNIVAVAPPVAEDREISEAVGTILQNKLRSDRYSVLDYENTAPLFSYYASDGGLTEKKAYRYNLFYDLRADRVLTSQVKSNRDGYSVKGELKNIYTGTTEATYSWEVSPTEQAIKDEVSTHNYYSSYFHFLPNTLFMNFSTFSSTLNVDGQAYPGESIRGRSTSEQVLDYLSSISFSHLNRPRRQVKRSWVFDFVPAVMVSQRKIEFETYVPLKDTSFERWFVSGGYGFEVGHQSSIGLFYFDLVPMVTWTQLTVNSSTLHDTQSRTLISSLTEIGYTKFFSDHLVGKVYLRGLNEDQSLWQREVRTITGRESKVDGASSSFAGIALGYYFPSSLRVRGEGWRANKTSPQSKTIGQ